MRNFATRLSNIIIEILTTTDEVTESQLTELASRLYDDGFTEETIIDEFESLLRRLKANG